ncbi:MAG: FtsX-like permease family protein [Gemmatimonadetes bacterium]|nr:FtsX-like permease family protein [Gemmatimonadota bacterium]
MTSFALAMARREARASRRRLALYMSSITLGVAALVAINSFRENVTAGINAEARNLLGADIELSSRQPFDSMITGILDSVQTEGVALSRVTSFASMALATRSGGSRLVEVRAVEGAFPYYGTIDTDPPGLWPELQQRRVALVDPALLVQVGAAVGDTLGIGETTFPIAGVVTRTPGEIALRTAIGPRVFIPGRYLDETQLLRFGSRARYLAFLRIQSDAAVQRFLNRNIQTLRDRQVGFDTVSERQDELADSMDMLARFLGLVGLVALLLGGVGVASAVNVFARDKLPTAAVLRCLGATQQTVFVIYVLQAAVLGVAGAAVGVVIGLVVQARLPALLSDFLPIEVGVSPDWGSALAGLGIGAWVAVLFALLPLLAVRNVSPLSALRREFDEAPRRHDPARVVTLALLGASVLAISVWQAPSSGWGLSFAAAVALTSGLLWGSATGLARGARRFFPRGAGYPLRQGIANLFRPHNQTGTVTLAVGFGAFLIATLYVVQRNLLDQVALDTRPDRPNLVMFDIQPDQSPGVVQVLQSRGHRIVQRTPMVPARVAAVNGRTVRDLLADSGEWRTSRWALRREYRHTYRDTLVESETLVAGRWWNGADGRMGGQAVARSGDQADRPPARPPNRLARISVEEDLAAELRVALGDRITWNVQGTLIETEIASLRRVNWARFEPNFFVVFEPGVLEEAPQNIVLLSRVDDPQERAVVQRDLVRQYANIAIVDLTLVQQTLDKILGSVSLAIRFMALFSIASGLVVLVGAIATSRFQRMRESALLKTLGASRAQITRIVATEYCAIGLVAALAGMILAGVSGWALTRFLFEVPFRLPTLALTTLGLGAAGATTIVGLANSVRVFRSTPLAVIREMAE